LVGQWKSSRQRSAKGSPKSVSHAAVVVPSHTANKEQSDDNIDTNSKFVGWERASTFAWAIKVANYINGNISGSNLMFGLFADICAGIVSHLWLCGKERLTMRVKPTLAQAPCDFGAYGLSAAPSLITDR